MKCYKLRSVVIVCSYLKFYTTMPMQKLAAFMDEVCSCHVFCIPNGISVAIFLGCR